MKDLHHTIEETEHEKSIALIREKCIAANPSIKDLVFGCEIESKENKSLWIFLGNTAGETRILGKSGIMYFDEIEHWNVIGREIRLADVLLAIGNDNAIAIEAGSGQFGEETPDGLNVGMCPSWNLIKDSLSDQSEETIDFIYNLLK